MEPFRYRQKPKHRKNSSGLWPVKSLQLINSEQGKTSCLARRAQRLNQASVIEGHLDHGKKFMFILLSEY